MMQNTTDKTISPQEKQQILIKIRCKYKQQYTNLNKDNSTLNETNQLPEVSLSNSDEYIDPDKHKVIDVRNIFQKC